MWETLLLVIGLVCILEGFGPAFFPNRWKQWLQSVMEADTSTVQKIGLGIVALGVILLWLAG